MRPRTPAAASGWLVPMAMVVLALPAMAQPRTTYQTRVFEFRVAAAGPHFGKAPVTPLPPAVQADVDRARGLAGVGRLEAARDVLDAALVRAPHHPLILTELAEVETALGAWKAVEKLARAERAAADDSLLLGQDLATALTRLGRPREAAQVVIEAWVASPPLDDWARTTLDTLSLVDPKGVREVVRRASAADPQRADLVRGAAALEWRLGDSAAALQLLAGADHGPTGSVRWSFAEEMLQRGSPRDSAGAIEVLLDLAGDRARDPAYRVNAARRVWDVGGGGAQSARRIASALQDVQVGRWGQPLAIGVIRALREGGATEDSRRLLRSLESQAQGIPEIAIERALNDLRDGPPERALGPLREIAGSSKEGAFRYGEALFFSGQPDSARAWYDLASRDPSSPFAGPALERLYLLEDAEPKSALDSFGRMSYERWRGDSRRALALADTLYRTLPRSSLWAEVAVALAALYEATGDGKAALEPLMALAQTLPDNRLAPIARQRAGDVYRTWFHDEAKALEQYEECLARYPKAWNAPEVRRWVETLRRERRF